MADDKKQSAIAPEKPTSTETKTPTPAVQAPMVEKKGKTGLILVVILMLILIGGVAVVRQRGAKNTASSAKKTAEQENTKKISKVKSAATILGISDKEAMKQGNEGTITYQPSTKISLNMPLTTGFYLTYSVSGDGVEVRVAQVKKVLADKGVGLDGDGGVSKLSYSNSEVFCDIADGIINKVTLSCIPKATLQTAKDNVKAVLAAAAKHNGTKVSEDTYSIQYLQSTDTKVNAAIYSNGSTSELIYAVQKNNAWTYISQSNFGAIPHDGDVLRDCAALNAPELNGVFSSLTSEAANCKAN